MNTAPYYKMLFSKVYPLYITKVQRKERTKDEVDQIISWLTGYSQKDIEHYAQTNDTFETFFNKAPRLNANRFLIKGMICGLRVEEIEDPLVQNIRYLDKLIDELYKGKSLEKILK
jgi:hypothetical protein